MTLHPIGIAFQRIYFAIVGQHTEGLRQPPLREGIGRIALVIQSKGRLEAFIFQIWIEFRHILCQEHAFIDNRPTGQAGQVKAVNSGRLRGFFDPAANDVELALKCLLVYAFGIGHQELLNFRSCGIGLFPQTGDIHRHMAPAVDVVAHAQNFGFHNRPAGFLGSEIRARQEHLPHGHQLVHTRRMAGAFDLIIEEWHRNLHMDASPVTCFAICIDRAAVPNRFERINTGLNHLAAWRPIDGHHKPHTTAGVLFRLRVKAIFSHILALGFFRFHPVRIKFCHAHLLKCPRGTLLCRKGPDPRRRLFSGDGSGLVKLC